MCGFCLVVVSSDVSAMGGEECLLACINTINIYCGSGGGGEGGKEREDMWLVWCSVV